MKLLDTLLVRPPEASPEDVAEIVQQYFGLGGNIEGLGGERDRNFRISADGADFLVKLANPSEPDEILDMQCQALRQIILHDPDLPVSRLVQPESGGDWVEVPSDSGSLRIRVFEFLHGLPLNCVAFDPALMHGLGEVLARLDRSLRGFFHPAASHPLAWNIQVLDQLSFLVDHVPKGRERNLALGVIAQFKEKVKPQLGGCRAQLIHNDVSFHNSVVDPDNPLSISGIFDFGDMVFGPLVQEIATTAAEMGAASDAPLTRAAEIIAGYHSITPLEDVEFSLLPDMMASRLVLTLLLESWSLSETDWQDDRDHLSDWRSNAVAALEIMKDAGAAEVENLVRHTCGAGTIGVRETAHHANALDLRNRFLGNASYISYDRPVHLERGRGVWLYDTDGEAHLDAYNNVPHAGHCHPRIVSAIASQTATLNTNTRYLYDVITDYAEKLTETLPGELDSCFFVSSGSEANDLAWRLATSVTGNSGGLILKNAYHGVTEAVHHLSPEGQENAVEPGHIAWVDPPDDFRGSWKRDNPDRGRHYAGYVETALDRLQDKGHLPAAMYLDMIMSSNGIFTPPSGYLEAAFARVRDAGGLCIADEVQSGFGRTGDHMWGFQYGDVVPDIVTFGKPIAGGYPMGLVVTTREIARRFNQEFFSTTGGNPVACAAALAMLDVMEEENLMENARVTGARLVAGLEDLAARHPLIGDVRGSGLFIGVELVTDPDTLEPATSDTRRIVNALRENRVLVGIDGPYRNVIKIRPPMVFNEHHVGLLLNCLEQVLAES